MTASAYVTPNWQKEIDNFKGIKNTFILEGNIHDLYPSLQMGHDQESTGLEFSSLGKIISGIFDSGETSGYYDFLFCDPLFGFTDPLNFNNTQELVQRYEQLIDEKSEELKLLNGKNKPGGSNCMMIQNSEIIRTAITQLPSHLEEIKRKSIIVMVNFASRFVSSPDNLSQDETTFFLNLLYASKNAIRGRSYINTLVLIVEKYNDIPAWFYLNNPHVRTIALPNPDRQIRKAYISKYFKKPVDPMTAQQAKELDDFTDLTDGMKLLELGELRRLRDKLKDSISDIRELIAIYKYGFKENPWETMRDEISIDIKRNIEHRVKSQDVAVDKIITIIKRAVSGLSGMQHSSGLNKPRGIVFLAGPTGTGKTELVKAVTEELFKDENKLIRFDMSEYSAEHSDQKLFGAPPGYVGYDNGGQLTNAVKANPFSVLLFDEIEKAHSSIMDKFLQILEDGRMTDGQGKTVYFSETFIFFTSNVGISREIMDPASGRIIGRENIVQPGEPYAAIQQKVEQAMQLYFKPEVINRIGENIVVFDYIHEQASQSIAQAQIAKINQNIKKQKHIEINADQSAHDRIYELCWQEKHRNHGGRGIGNVVEEYYLNPLAEFLYDRKIQPGNQILVKRDGDYLVFDAGQNNV